MAELVDAADSKSVARKGVLVRFRPGAPNVDEKKARVSCARILGLLETHWDGLHRRATVGRMA